MQNILLFRNKKEKSIYLIALVSSENLCKPLLETDLKKKTPKHDGGAVPQEGVDTSLGQRHSESMNSWIVGVGEILMFI